MSNYSIWALECAQLPDYPNSALLYGATEGGRMLPFMYWVIQSEDRVVLVDTGFNNDEWCRGQFESYGVIGFKEPSEVLSRIGLTPADVDTIVITHHHFDHASGLQYFPNAQVVIQRREVDNWFAKFGAPHRCKWLAGGLDPATGAEIAKIGGEGRLRLVEGTAAVAPGIHVRAAVDSHTAGSQYVVLEANDGGDPWIFTGDVVYLYDNVGGIDLSGQLIPVGLAQGSQECLVRVMDEILTLSGDKTDRIIPSHEVLLWDRFPTQEYDDGLHCAEIVLAPGVTSRIQK